MNNPPYRGSIPFPATMRRKELHVDIETYSSIDIKSCGAYRYLQSVDFEILLVAYAFDNEEVQIVDLAQGEELPIEFTTALTDPTIRKYAHNAAFEREAFKNFGIKVPIEQWTCTAVHAAYCGLPLSLDMVSKALNFGEDKAKQAAGKALIRYFCIPCKPTKTNGYRYRNLPEHDPEKWEAFKDYCVQDVVAERSIEERLEDYPLPDFEKKMYVLDQEINDRGIMIDADMARKAYQINEDYSKILTDKVKKLTGVENPNSIAQLKEWISNATGSEVKSLAKQQVSDLLESDAIEPVKEVLRLRQKLSKSSIKKYTAMLNCICNDSRGHGFFQFYGANRTGRWAGRLVQLQNLTKNYLPDLTLARETVKEGDYKKVELLYGDVSDTLSQLIRTTFVAPAGKTFAVADFSAIEARVIAWLANETWRLDVFKSHGKIYEASASSMFKVPIEEVTKGSELRQKAKIAELALGYQGSIGALTTMGGEQMGLSKDEMEDIVYRWRQASPRIVQFWKDLEGCAKLAVRTMRPVTSKHRGLVFDSNGKVMTIKLPSGRKLFYCNPMLKKKTVRKDNGETWEAESLVYAGMDQVKRQWSRVDTYGGKLAENITQAVARDLLAEAMQALKGQGFDIVMHVHDEIVCEIPKNCPQYLDGMVEFMSKPIRWAKGLPLAADGYLTDYYKKD